MVIMQESQSLYQFAKELGGIAASIEHRYFGKSAPFGADSYTNDNFRHLTLDNIMDDSVKFVRELRANVSGAEHSPAIVGSGSYGAYLTTALRLNRPDDIFGALAAAPPVAGFYRGREPAPTGHDWLNWVSNVIADRSSAAAKAIKDAFGKLDAALKAGETAALHHQLGLCREPNRPGDDELLTLALTNVYTLSTEFNYPYISRGRNAIANPLDKLVDTVLAHKDDAFAMLAAATRLWNNTLNSPASCLDFEETLESSVPLIQWTPFKYITCKCPSSFFQCGTDKAIRYLCPSCSLGKIRRLSLPSNRSCLVGACVVLQRRVRRDAFHRRRPYPAIPPLAGPFRTL